jgi:CBS domain-containing protein
MRCRDLMKTDVVFCRTTDPIYRVAEAMRAEGIGFMPVLDNMRRLVGVVTDRDLTLRALARRLDFLTPVERVMTTDLITCKALDNLEVAQSRMAENQKSRIPVIDDFGECVGIISLSDIAQALAPAESGVLLGRVTERESHVEAPQPAQTMH